jgi:hypothetical protein
VLVNLAGSPEWVGAVMHTKTAPLNNELNQIIIQ